MNHEPKPTPLSAEQKAQICGILSVGCDRQTAADYIGCSLADIRRHMERNSSFLANIRRAEASVELSHMRTVQEVAKDKKEWRAAVWWLERRSPERFGRRGPDAVTARQLKAFVAILVDAIKHDVTNSEDLARIVARMQTIAESVEQMLHDAQFTALEPVNPLGAPLDEQQSDTPAFAPNQMLLPFDDSAGM